MDMPHASFEAGTLPARWTPESPDCARVPPFAAHEYNHTFVIIRQSGCAHFEKPFLYLLFGSTQAMLVDTGAEGGDLWPVVDGQLRRDAARRGRPPLPLLVVHSHNHSDHVANDGALAQQPGVRVIGTSVQTVAEFFGIERWPNDVGAIDLGHRVLDIVPIPGHEVSSIAMYDRTTGILLSGDTLYPGRLYVRDAAAFRDSIDRLVDFTATRPVTHILGGHIENARTPFLDYPEGTMFQPDEHALELGRAHLLELQDGLRHMGDPLPRRAFRDFTIWPVPPGK
jgi:hydroxyacylglutathione hydrolase